MSEILKIPDIYGKEIIVTVKSENGINTGIQLVQINNESTLILRLGKKSLQELVEMLARQNLIKAKVETDSREIRLYDKYSNIIYIPVNRLKDRFTNWLEHQKDSKWIDFHQRSILHIFIEQEYAANVVDSAELQTLMETFKNNTIKELFERRKYASRN